MDPTQDPGIVGITDEQLDPASTAIPGGESFAIAELQREIRVLTLSDAATIDVDAARAKTHLLTAGGNRTLNAPVWTKKDGAALIIKHTASGADRTLTLTTGSAGAFRFGTTVSGLTATISGKSDYIGCKYNATDDRWDVVSVSKGY